MSWDCCLGCLSLVDKLWCFLSVFYLSTLHSLNLWTGLPSSVITWGLLTPVFGTTMNLYNMTSNEEVLYMKKLGIVDVYNFVVQAIVIRFYLNFRNYVWSNKILAFEALFCQLGHQDILKLRNLLHRAASSRRTDRFWYLKRPNPSPYEKVTAETVCCCKASQRASQESSDVRREKRKSDGKGQ